MNEQRPSSNNSIPSSSHHPRSTWLAVIGAGSVLAICATLYQSSQTETLRGQVVASQQDNDALRAKVVQSDTSTILNPACSAYFG